MRALLRRAKPCTHDAGLVLAVRVCSAAFCLATHVPCHAACASQANENLCIFAHAPFGRSTVFKQSDQDLSLVLQGAAVAAVLCALQQQALRAPPDPTGPGSDAEPWPPLRFAVLCSGFTPLCPEHQRLLAAEAPLRLPSLHIYGAQRHADRQARSRFGKP